VTPRPEELDAPPGQEFIATARTFVAACRCRARAACTPNAFGPPPSCPLGRDTGSSSAPPCRWPPTATCAAAARSHEARPDRPVSSPPGYAPASPPASAAASIGREALADNSAPTTRQVRDTRISAHRFEASRIVGLASTRNVAVGAGCRSRAPWRLRCQRPVSPR
jgi:hypothetical protein